MAFTPNQVGVLYRVTGRDIHGRPTLSEALPCKFAVVNAKRQSEKTSVRADSSASRGAADEITTGLGRILVARHQVIEIGDIFVFDGDSYDVNSKHVRRSVSGQVDHYECDLEVRPR
jgi:hypothetical protein